MILEMNMKGQKEN